MVNINASRCLEITGNISSEFTQILSPDALEFISRLEQEFRSTRLKLLENRTERQKELESGVLPNFLASTKQIREDRSWKIGGVPKDLQNRRVEITGPVDRKMMSTLSIPARMFLWQTLKMQLHQPGRT